MVKTNPASRAFRFEPKATQYSAINAYALVRCADLAYKKKKKDVEKQITRWGFSKSNFEFFDRGSTQGFAIANQEMAIFAFRGTEFNLDDALTDSNIAWTKGTFNSQVHKGFSQALAKVLPAVRQMMRKYQRGGTRRIWFTGHSLGAALATLAAARMLESDFKVAGVVTFGSPRVGNGKFARSLNAKLKNHYRMVFGKDLVTRIPPRAFKYAHCGRLTTIAKNGNIFHRGFSETSFWKNIFHTLEDLRSHDFKSIEDHKLKNGYLPLLRKRAVR